MAYKTKQEKEKKLYKWFKINGIWKKVPIEKSYRIGKDWIELYKD